MAGSKTASEKAVATMYRLHGPDHFKRAGQLGGRKSKGGGFANNPELASRAGKIGGAISKRRPGKPKVRKWLTGQEWYDRFVAELSQSTEIPQFVLEAARRAANLTDTET